MFVKLGFIRVTHLTGLEDNWMSPSSLFLWGVLWWFRINFIINGSEGTNEHWAYPFHELKIIWLLNMLAIMEIAFFFFGCFGEVS